MSHLRKTFYDKTPVYIRDLVGRFFANLDPRLKYGRDFSKSYNLLRDSQYWDIPSIQEYQLRNLRAVCLTANRATRHYNSIFQSVGFEPSQLSSFQRFQELPLLTRNDVSSIDRTLVSDNLGRGKYKYTTTGGTSGRPMGFYVSHAASAREWAFMLRNWERIGFQPNHRRVVLRGHLINGRQEGRLREEDYLNNALYFSSFDMNDSNLKMYVQKMKEYQPDFLHAYPSSATVLANFIERTGDEPPTFRGLLLGSENFFPSQQEYLEKIFRCRVFSWYGHSEKCILAGECEEGSGYHIFPEYGFVELIDNAGNVIVEPDKPGFLVGTSFINDASLLIRYLTDDQAEWVEGKCGCGRMSPRLKNVAGRWQQEMLVGNSGALFSMTAINLHSENYTKMIRFQFVQDIPGKASLLIVPSESFTNLDERRILSELDAKLAGELEITVERVTDLQITGLGKFKFIDQRLDLDYFVWNR